MTTIRNASGEAREYIPIGMLCIGGENDIMQLMTQLCTARSVGRKPTLVSYVPDGSDLQPMASLRRMKRWPFYDSGNITRA